ncbi:class I adenylate-forming enzyme family protein [Leucobacter sp. G161]|uniref:class I adenylate-forming enzyme family protein n=1 Tax=Leucobacter sp. G161 TaxID=663704 RepID=UPI00073CCA58|nr:class I adenylate-forming enzyme family protein [Leucobacter sp. G161]KUF05633.1 hypothetical protein AUL38_03920 [Leucobacter sp. G161]
MTLTTSYHPADTSRPILDCTLGDLLHDAAADSPNEQALIGIAPVSPPRSWTYRELLEDAERGATWLLQRFPVGSHIAVWAANEPEWLILQCATALAGMTLVTANPALRATELAHILDASDASAVAFSAEVRGTAMIDILLDALDQLRVRRAGTAGPIPSLIPFTGWLDAIRAVEPDPSRFPSVLPSDAIQLQFTSGTTGLPKPAQLTHRAMITNADYVNTRGGYPEGGVSVSPIPLFHASGSGTAAFGAMLLRGTLVLCRVFDPALVVDAIDRFGATDVRMVPAMFRAAFPEVRAQRPTFATLRLCGSGGDTIPVELSREIEETFGAPLTTVYGQTEVSPVLAQTAPEDSEQTRWESAGAVLPQAEVKIVDTATGEVTPIGAPGEICARGYQLVDGYYEMPGATEQLIDADGWLHTGDLGTLSADGILTVTGRLKDLIIRGGENLYPSEIEAALLEHPRVALAAVVGLPDEQWGEVVAAVIEHVDPQSPVSAAELTAFTTERLSPQKRPATWLQGGALPANAMGKLQKFRLREQILAGAFQEL